MRGSASPRSSSISRTNHRSCWPCRAVGWRSAARSPAGSARRSTSCWCARSACRGSRSWRSARWRGPAWLVLAAPVAAAETLAALADEADETVCVAAPEGLGAIGYYYEDFHQMDDAEVTALLARDT